MAVLYGVFLFMGVSALNGMQVSVKLEHKNTNYIFKFLKTESLFNVF